jgi:hypothetical protein
LIIWNNKFSWTGPVKKMSKNGVNSFALGKQSERNTHVYHLSLKSDNS